MSAVAIHFDPTFNMGPRSAFAWPGTFESSHSAPSMLGQDFSAVLSDPSVSPSSTSRSLTSSPPRTILTPEQRELKRQRDRARRDSRVSTRMHRADSVSYMSSSPMAMSDATSAMALPVYTTAPGAVSVLAESATALASQSYIPSYNTPLQDQTQAQVFTSPYQQPLQPTYSMSMEYPTAYAGHSEYSLQSSLPTVGQDGSMMYRMPAVMVTSSSAGTPTAVTSNGGSNGAQESSSHVRVVQSRPKPRCWEHGCNGRQFSTFSNLLRHQREKSGQAAKATCPNCGAEFTRTTARNGHLLHDKCKQRRNT